MILKRNRLIVALSLSLVFCQEVHGGELPLAARKALAKQISETFDECSKGREWVMGIEINPETGGAVFTWDRPSRPGQDKKMVWFDLADIDRSFPSEGSRLYLQTRSGKVFKSHWTHWSPSTKKVEDDWFAEEQIATISCSREKVSEVYEALKTLAASFQ